MLKVLLDEANALLSWCGSIVAKDALEPPPFELSIHNAVRFR